MRIDSCRKCGTALCIVKNCNDCEHPIQFECKECKRLTEMQIHFQCNEKNPQIAVLI